MSFKQVFKVKKNILTTEKGGWGGRNLAVWNSHLLLQFIVP